MGMNGMKHLFALFSRIRMQQGTQFKEFLRCNELQMYFKVRLVNQIHNIDLLKKVKIEQLKAVLSTTFKSLPPIYTLKYLDEDGDEINLMDQGDYDVLRSFWPKNRRIIISKSNEEFIDLTNQAHSYQSKIEQIEEEVSEIKPIQEVHLPEPHYLEEDFSPKLTPQEPEFHPEVPSIDDSLIEQKLKTMLPIIISQIKADLTQEIKQKSIMSHNISQTTLDHSNLVVHRTINCGGCGQKGIQGIRYKCAVCPNFDLCSICEAKSQHDHPFLKIKTLKQTPIEIKVRIDSEEDCLEVNSQRSGIPSSLNNLTDRGFNIVEGYLSSQNSQQAHQQNESFIFAPKKQKKVGEKVRMDKKKQGKVEKIVEQPKVAESKPVAAEKMELEVSKQTFIENAKYLAGFLGIATKNCMKFAKQFPNLSKEDLLNLYFCQPALFDQHK